MSDKAQLGSAGRRVFRVPLVEGLGSAGLTEVRVDRRAGEHVRYTPPAVLATPPPQNAPSGGFSLAVSRHCRDNVRRLLTKHEHGVHDHACALGSTLNLILWLESHRI